MQICELREHHLSEVQNRSSGFQLRSQSLKQVLAQINAQISANLQAIEKHALSLMANLDIKLEHLEAGDTMTAS